MIIYRKEQEKKSMKSLIWVKMYIFHPFVATIPKNGIIRNPIWVFGSVWFCSVSHDISWDAPKHF